MIDLLLLEGRLITMDGERRILENAAVAVDKGRILEVGSSPELEERHQAERVVRCGGNPVLPGLINCREELSPAFAGELDYAGAFALGRLAAWKGLFGGTTTLLGFTPKAHRENSAAVRGFRAGCEAVGVRFVLGAPQKPEGYDGAFRRCVQADEGDLLEESFVAGLAPDALVQVAEDAVISFPEWKNLERSGAAVCLLSARGHRRNPVSELIAVGIPTAVAPRPDQPGLLEGVRHQAFQENLAHDDERYLQAGKLLELLTVDGARCLGLEGETGSLEAGKRADILVADWNQARLAPHCIPAQRIAFWGMAGDFSTVISGGRLVLENRELRTADSTEIMAEALAAFPVKVSMKSR